MKGWQTKKLGELLERVETVNPLQSPETEFDYIDVSSVSNESFLIERTARLKGEEAPSRARRLVRTGDVLFATVRPTLRRIAIVPSRLDRQVCSTGYFVMRPKEEIDYRFLFYSLFTDDFMRQMAALQKGASYPAVTDSDVRSQALSYPPLPEQRRIVRMLEEAFAGVAAAKAGAEQALRNARSLFESYRESVFTEPGSDWPEKPLKDVCEIKSVLVDPRQSQYLDLMHVGAGNIEAKTGTFVDLKSARQERLISGKFVFDSSTTLYSKIRPYLMKAARPEFRGLCSADMYPLSPLPDRLTRDYLFHLLLSKRFTDYAIEGSARAGMPKVNREHLFKFRFSVPPIKTQIEQANRLDALHDEVRSLEDLYRRKLAELDELKRSLLHQAFSGQL